MPTLQDIINLFLNAQADEYGKIWISDEVRWELIKTLIRYKQEDDDRVC